MTAEIPFDIFSRTPPTDERAPSLFEYELTYRDRLVMRLIATDADVDRIRVAAEIYPVDAPFGSEPQWRFHDFPTRARAQTFADECLLALEYLGCVVNETPAVAPRAPAEPAPALEPAAA